jgi:hypothetical protein
MSDWLCWCRWACSSRGGEKGGAGAQEAGVSYLAQVGWTWLEKKAYLMIGRKLGATFGASRQARAPCTAAEE